MMQEKKLTLKSAFVKVFGEGLAPLGFVRLKKTKLPFFARLVNVEVRDHLINTPHLHALAIQEAERRKAVNTELLRAHGLPL